MVYTSDLHFAFHENQFFQGPKLITCHVLFTVGITNFMVVDCELVSN